MTTKILEYVEEIEELMVDMESMLRAIRLEALK